MMKNMTENGIATCSVHAGPWIADKQAVTHLAVMPAMFARQPDLHQQFASIEPLLGIRQVGAIRIVEIEYSLMCSQPTRFERLIGCPSYEGIGQLIDDASADVKTEGILLVVSSKGGMLDGLEQLRLRIKAANVFKPVFALGMERMDGAAMAVISACGRVYGNPDCLHACALRSWRIQDGEYPNPVECHGAEAVMEMIVADRRLSPGQQKMVARGLRRPSEFRTAGIVDDFTPREGSLDYVMEQLQIEIRRRAVK